MAKAKTASSVEPGGTRRRTCIERFSPKDGGRLDVLRRWTRAYGDTSGPAMRVVDTNVLVRLVTRDDAKQVARAEAFVKVGAWVSHLVLVEMAWVLSAVYNLKPKQIALAIEMLLHHAQLTVQDSDVVEAALEHYRTRSILGFSDCLVLESARKAGHLPLGTFDRDFGKLNGAVRL